MELKDQIKYKDWKFRGLTPIAGTAQNDMGNWEFYLPITEVQNASNYDRQACVTYSILNCIEALYKYQFQVERNFSDRYIAQLSGTTHSGNSLAKVFETIQEYGLVDEELWPDNATTWEEYYKSVPQEIVNEGLVFKQKYNLFREWVNPNNESDIEKALESAPLQATVRYTTGDGILMPSGEPNHAVVIYGCESGKYWKIFDSYQQSKKRYNWNYKFGVVLKPSLIKKKPMIIQDNQLYCLIEGPSQLLGMGYQGKLVIYTDKIDTIINSLMRSKKWQIPTPVHLSDWNSVDHLNGKLEPI